MKVQKITNTVLNNYKLSKNKLSSSMKYKTEFLDRCRDVRKKKIKDLTINEIPFLGAAIGLLTPIPLGFIIGFLLGKIVEHGINIYKNKKH